MATSRRRLPRSQRRCWNLVSNAYIKLSVPKIGTLSDYRGAYTETAQTAVRCRVTQVSAQKYAAAVGLLSDSGWVCRLRTTQDVRPGWRCEIQRDDWSGYREFEVTSVAQHGYHTRLTLSGGVG